MMKRVWQHNPYNTDGMFGTPLPNSASTSSPASPQYHHPSSNDYCSYDNCSASTSTFSASFDPSGTRDGTPPAAEFSTYGPEPVVNGLNHQMVDFQNPCAPLISQFNGVWAPSQTHSNSNSKINTYNNSKKSQLNSVKKDNNHGKYSPNRNHRGQQQQLSNGMNRKKDNAKMANVAAVGKPIFAQQLIKKAGALMLKLKQSTPQTQQHRSKHADLCASLLDTFTAQYHTDICRSENDCTVFRRLVESGVVFPLSFSTFSSTTPDDEIFAHAFKIAMTSAERFTEVFTRDPSVVLGMATESMETRRILQAVLEATEEAVLVALSVSSPLPALVETAIEMYRAVAAAVAPELFSIAITEQGCLAVKYLLNFLGSNAEGNKCTKRGGGSKGHKKKGNSNAIDSDNAAVVEYTQRKRALLKDLLLDTLFVTRRDQMPSLSCHRYGNYVVQCALDSITGFAMLDVGQYICDCFAGSFLELCRNKFSSNVVEKIVRLSASTSAAVSSAADETGSCPGLRRTLLEELVTPTDAINLLVNDAYGNFVVQALLETTVSKDGTKCAISEHAYICHQLQPVLHNTPYSNGIQSKMVDFAKLH